VRGLIHANQQCGTLINTWPFEWGNGRIIQAATLLTQPIMCFVVTTVWQNATFQAKLLSAKLWLRTHAKCTS